jgi:hypothetical protein
LGAAFFGAVEAEGEGLDGRLIKHEASRASIGCGEHPYFSLPAFQAKSRPLQTSLTEQIL